LKKKSKRLGVKPSKEDFEIEIAEEKEVKAEAEIAEEGRRSSSK
jgi:hypothetical protein